MKVSVALAGNPNCGKTTLFNYLAGTNYHVANYAGVTVEKKTAKLNFKDTTIELVDLPGTYSLTPYSLEEKVARNYIVNKKPDLILQVIDASNLERNLYLTLQLLELGIPIIIALNMVDVAKQREVSIDKDLLAQRLGVSVIETIARSGHGTEEVLNGIVNFKKSKSIAGMENFSYGEDVNLLLIELTELIQKNNFLERYSSAEWVALKYIENDEEVVQEGKQVSEKLHSSLKEIIEKVKPHSKDSLDSSLEAIVADYRYSIIGTLLKGVVKREGNSIDRIFISDRIDRVLTQRFLGPIILLSILYFSYQFTFWASEYPIMWIESFFEFTGSLVSSNLPEGLLRSLIVDGMIGGVGGILGFTPLIMFMFFVIAILEDSGYMARVAYMLDRLFRFFGLQGNSVLPYIVSGGIAGGCAVPGVMATRTIKSPKERLLTILTAPFMACGAKLPVFALLISAFFPGDKSLLMLGITALSWLCALIVAKILGSTIVKGESSSFIMELPPYRLPVLKGLFLHSWERTRLYIKKAGTTILAMSIVLWVFMTFPQLPENKVKEFETQRNVVIQNFSDLENNKKLQQELSLIANEEAQAALKYSVAGKVGSFIEPVTKYAGFDWRTNIALLGGFAAKEVVVSTLGIAYSLGDVDPENSASLATKLARDPLWDAGVALSLIFFTILYAPCFVTVVMISRESGSWKWGAFTVIGYSALALAVSMVVNNVF